MREDKSILERIGRALHDGVDEIVHQPLPERWSDLINRLSLEQVRAESGEPNSEPREHRGPYGPTKS